jgi:FkbM family methyltransferase
MRRPFGGRPLSALLAAPLRRRNYRALAGAVRRYRTPVRDLWRYLSHRGSYPYRCRIRTPLTEVAPLLYGPHDMLTATEVFCKRVYPVQSEARVIVDVGANIGLSALYFLTEAPRSRLHLFEPNPALGDRLRSNLAGFADRVGIEDVALAAAGGRAEFGVEPTGRYGGIGVAGSSGTIEVECRAAGAVLGEIAREEGGIDLLKIDIEGGEVELLRSLDPELVRRIGRIHVETELDSNPLPGLVEIDREGLISTLVPIAGRGRDA